MGSSFSLPMIVRVYITSSISLLVVPTGCFWCITPSYYCTFYHIILKKIKLLCCNLFMAFYAQLGRRNLNPMQRIAVAEKYRPIYERLAKEKQGTRTDILTKSSKHIESISTRQKLSEVAGVSEDTYAKAKKKQTVMGW